MHTVDLTLVVVLVVLAIGMIAVLARQRQMLRTMGALPLAVQRGNRWLYGVGRYVGAELRWYRALGIATHPSRVLRRGHVEVLNRRSPRPNEKRSLPANAIIVECLSDGEPIALAIGQSAYTAFVSWLESAAPR